MRKLMALMIFVGCLAMFSGCSNSATGMQNLSETSKERKARIKRQQQDEWQMAVEDWDRFWLNEHRTRLSPNNM